jgi:dihydropteroate synthase type 2
VSAAAGGGRRAPRPRIVGVVNVTADSFSDGGRYLDPGAARAHALALAAAGADVVELGAAASSPDAEPVASSEEVRRLAPVLAALVDAGLTVGVDSMHPATQIWAAEQGARYVNDVQGFPDPAVHPELARLACHLVVMHSVQRRGGATRVETDAACTLEGIHRFFDERLRALEAAGVARERLIIDPGMGFFLGATPEPSVLVLRHLAGLRARFDLPVLISVSRKSFLGALTGRDVADRGAATLAAELFAAESGVDYIRTHDVAALRDALVVREALDTRPPGGSGAP